MEMFLPYLTPENITLAFGAAGGIVAVALIILMFLNRKSIGEGVSSVWQGIFSQGGLFYFGMGLFMLASVVEAGPVINKIAMHGALWGYGGHMLIFAFDVVAAVCLRARLNARRVADNRGMKVQMWGIWVPAVVSIIANLAGAIQGFNPNDFSQLWIFAGVLPLIGAVFPSMIVILSLAADHMIDTTAITKKIDVKEFEAQELKRVEVLKVRLKVESELLAEEKKIAEVRRSRDEAQKNEATHEWFFMRWLYPEKMTEADALKLQIEAAVSSARDVWMKQSEAGLKLLSEEMKRTRDEGQQTLTLITTELSQIASASQALVQRIDRQDEQLQQLSLKQQVEASTFEELKLNNKAIASLRSKIEGVAREIEGLKHNHKSASTSPSKMKNEASISNGSASKKLKAIPIHGFTEVQIEASNQSETDETGASKEERAFNFIEDYRQKNEGVEPSLEAIMEEVNCSQGSASNYRARYRKMNGSSDVAVASNGHQ